MSSEELIYGGHHGMKAPQRINGNGTNLSEEPNYVSAGGKRKQYYCAEKITGLNNATISCVGRELYTR